MGDLPGTNPAISPGGKSWLPFWDSPMLKLGGGFKYFLFSPLPGICLDHLNSRLQQLQLHSASGCCCKGDPKDGTKKAPYRGIRHKIYIDVSENSGFSPPKSSHLFIGFSIINFIHFGGNTPIFGNTHMGRGMMYIPKYTPFILDTLCHPIIL